MSEFRKLQSDEQPSEIVDTDTSTSLRKVVIIDEKELVNGVDTQKFQIRNFSNFSESSSVSKRLKQEDTMRPE